MCVFFPLLFDFTSGEIFSNKSLNFIIQQQLKQSINNFKHKNDFKFKCFSFLIIDVNNNMRMEVLYFFFKTYLMPVL